VSIVDFPIGILRLTLTSEASSHASENNVRPLFSAVIRSKVTHWLRQTAYPLQTPCSHSSKPPTLGLHKACHSRRTDTERVSYDDVCHNGGHADKGARMFTMTA
jgi:hypothetical protein